MSPSGSQSYKAVVAGCGGQGVLSATRVLGDAARSVGIPLRAGQLHGLAQRGGMVEGTLVMGPGNTGFVGPGQADLVLGLEPLETQRALPRMSAETRVLLNPHPIPLTILAWLGKDYPPIEQVLEKIRTITPHVWILDAATLADRLGNAKVQNSIMLGGLSALDVLPFSDEVLRSTIDRLSPPRFADLNHSAFELGRSTMTRTLEEDPGHVPDAKTNQESPSTMGEEGAQDS